HRLVAHRDEALDEARGQAVLDREEEQPGHGLVPRYLGMVEELVPARALFGLRASAEDRDPERGVDVLAVHQEVRGAFRHGSTLRAPRALHVLPGARISFRGST